MQTSEGTPPSLVNAVCASLFGEEKTKAPRATSCLITIDCSLHFSVYMSPSCLHSWKHAHILCAGTPSNKLTSRWVQNVPRSHALITQGAKPAVSSLPTPPYLLIKEPLNSQKLHRVQEWSMHSNTIRERHNFFPSTLYLYGSQIFLLAVLYLVLSICENYKSIHTGTF